MAILKATLAYHGGNYVGWQRQKNGPSLQQLLEETLAKISGKKVGVHGSSRTDAGVHALGFVASFQWPARALDPSKLHRALNGILPADLRVLSLEKAPPRFHARFSAKWKLYRYRILNGPMADPFQRDTAWFIHSPLNLAAMRRAAKHFVGKHNFSSLAVNPGYERFSMVRTIRRCAVIRKTPRPPFKGAEIHVEVEGNSFLYKMARTLAGTLVEVGLGKREPDSLPALLRARDRKLAGKTAPAHGLFLVRVFYSPSPSRTISKRHCD